jgi:hypothetical protein
VKKLELAIFMDHENSEIVALVLGILGNLTRDADVCKIIVASQGK